MTALDDFLGRVVVVDLKGPYVCLGQLKRADELYLELRNADFHDMRDSDTTREIYIAGARATGVKRNRKRILLMRSEVVAISDLDDVVDD